MTREIASSPSTDSAGSLPGKLRILAMTRKEKGAEVDAEINSGLHRP